MAGKIRLFVAVQPPEDLRLAMFEQQSRVASRLPRRAVKWVPRWNHHVTLVFLGSVEQEDVEGIRSIMNDIAGHHQPMRLVVDGPGWFASRGGVRVIFRKVEGDTEAMVEVAGELRQALASYEGVDDKAFVPHITLGRVRRGSRLGPDRVAAAFRDAGEPEPLEWIVEEMILFRSDLRPQGPVYTPIHTARFG